MCEKLFALLWNEGGLNMCFRWKNELETTTKKSDLENPIHKSNGKNQLEIQLEIVTW